MVTPKLPRSLPITALRQPTGAERYVLLDSDHPAVGPLTEEERWELGIVRRLSEIGNEIAVRYPDAPDEKLLELIVCLSDCTTIAESCVGYLLHGRQSPPYKKND
jgi:hypothetical protein